MLYLIFGFGIVLEVLNLRIKCEFMSFNILKWVVRLSMKDLEDESFIVIVNSIISFIFWKVGINVF